jgi:predicted nucleic acid-binding protein
MEVSTIVDAGPLVGWFNAADQWHEWSVAALSIRKGSIHTTEIVLGEALHHLGGNSAAAQALLSLVRRGAVELHRIWPEDLRRTQELMLKYEVMDAADASLVVLSERCPKATVITTDSRHFQTYRRSRNKAIPLILPH